MTKIPSREINNPEKYIGGDAYNYQIEASLLAGEIAGAKATKAIYLLGGFILFFGSFIALGFSINSRTNSTSIVPPINNISPINEQPKKQDKGQEYLVITDTAIRESGKHNSYIEEELKTGSKVYLKKSSKYYTDWYYVESENGKRGWCFVEHLQEAKAG